MAYLSLYRKWRPQAFSEVVGQEHIVRTLTNALATGRVAHAYLFSGPRGTGKTTFARLLAKGLNCEQGPTGSPCNQCDNCTRITRGLSVDVIEIDGASNRGIDEIRELRDRVKYAPTSGKFKVYIIDEVHMLTNEAFNALLKVLEEPPAHVVFVFATTEAHKVPATILSRCQKFDFRRFSPTQLMSQLEKVVSNEGVKAEPQALALIARHAEGGMRDALATLDQCISGNAGELTALSVAEVLGVVRREALSEMAGYILLGNLPDGLLLVHSLLDEGVEARQLLKDMAVYFRDLVLLKAAPDTSDLVAAEGADRQKMQDLAAHGDLSRLLAVVEVLSGSDAEMRWATNPVMAAEIAIVKAITAGNTVQTPDNTANQPTATTDGLEQRVKALEAALQQLVNNRTPVTPVSVPPVEKAAPVLEVPETAKPVAAAPVEKTPPSEPQPIIDAPATGKDADMLGKLQAQWSTVLATLKDERAISIEAFLRVGTPGAIQGRTVVIYFSPGHKFHQANIDNARNKSVVERAISRVLGTEMVVSTAVGTPPPAPVATRPLEHSVNQEEQSQPAVVSTEPAAITPTTADSQQEPVGTGLAEQAASEDRSEPEPHADALQSPAVQKALRYFDGRVVQVQET